MFALLGNNPFAALYVYFIEPLTDSWSLAGDRGQGGAADPDRGRPVALLPRQHLEHRRRGPVHRRRHRRQLACRCCTHGTDAGRWVLPPMLILGTLGGAPMRSIPAICKMRFGANEILTSLMLVYVAELLLDWLVRGPWRDPQGLQFPDDSRTSIRSPRCRLLIDGGRLHRGVDLRARRRRRWRRSCSRRTHQGLRDPRARPAPRAGALRRLQLEPLVIFTFLVSGALAGLAGIIEVAGPIGHLQPGDLAGLRLHRHHRRLPRPAQSDRHPGRRAVPGADLHRRRGGADRASKIPLDLTKVFQGMLLFFVLACDTLILYRIRRACDCRGRKLGAADGTA